jgi:subtilisin family serine protease
MDNASVENWIIGVSSVDKNDKLSKFANYGSCVDLVAPGEDIFSTQRYAPVYGYDKEFSGPWQGTSFSVPLVAGAAALLKSFHPDWSAQNIISALLKSSDDISVKNPNFSGALGFGRLNVGQAMESSTVTFVSPDYSSLEGYYFKNDIIYIKKDEVNYFFAGAGEAKIIALGSTRSFNNKHDEVVVLVMRGKHYFVQFFNDQGKKWKEMAVPLGDYSNKKKPIKIKFLNDISGRKIQLEFLESIKKGNKKIVKKVTVKQYDWLDND